MGLGVGDGPGECKGQLSGKAAVKAWGGPGECEGLLFGKGASKAEVGFTFLVMRLGVASAGGPAKGLAVAALFPAFLGAMTRGVCKDKGGSGVRQGKALFEPNHTNTNMGLQSVSKMVQ